MVYDYKNFKAIGVILIIYQYKCKLHQSSQQHCKKIIKLYILMDLITYNNPEKNRHTKNIVKSLTNAPRQVKILDPSTDQKIIDRRPINPAIIPQP